MSNEEIRPEVPLLEEDFADILKEYCIGLKADRYKTIAKHLSRVGGPDVYEDLENSAQRLIDWSGEIDPVKRRLILEHWSCEKNLPVSEEVLKRVAIAEPKREKFQKEQERQKAEEEGRIWTIEGRTSQLIISFSAINLSTSIFVALRPYRPLVFN